MTDTPAPDPGDDHGDDDLAYVDAVTELQRPGHRPGAMS